MRLFGWTAFGLRIFEQPLRSLALTDATAVTMSGVGFVIEAIACTEVWAAGS